MPALLFRLADPAVFTSARNAHKKVIFIIMCEKMQSEFDAAADLVSSADLHCCHGPQLLLHWSLLLALCSACSVTCSCSR